MTWILNNDDVAQVLTMEATIEALEQSYRSIAAGTGLNVPRADAVMQSPRGEVYHALKTMSGADATVGLAAVRVDSDLLHWSARDGNVRRTKLTAGQDTALRVGKENGLVLLYSQDNGELLAIVQDGHIQRMRVAGTAALAMRYLASPEATTLALLGSGYQAEMHLRALAMVRQLSSVRVFSPDPVHRGAFAERMRDQLDLDVYPVDTAEEAVRGADIVHMVTNSMEPVVDDTWVTPGMHLSTTRNGELPARTVTRADVVVVHSRTLAIPYIQPGHEHVVPELQSGDYGVADLERAGFNWQAVPELADVVAGRAPGRTARAQVTCFINSIGLGTQFVAVGGQVLSAVRQAGVGREVPSDWFLQGVYQA